MAFSTSGDVWSKQCESRNHSSMTLNKCMTSSDLTDLKGPTSRRLPRSPGYTDLSVLRRIFPAYTSNTTRVSKPTGLSSPSPETTISSPRSTSTGATLELARPVRPSRTSPTPTSLPALTATTTSGGTATTVKIPSSSTSSTGGSSTTCFCACATDIRYKSPSRVARFTSGLRALFLRATRGKMLGAGFAGCRRGPPKPIHGCGGVQRNRYATQTMIISSKLLTLQVRGLVPRRPRHQEGSREKNQGVVHGPW